ncbi:unnamed protein product [Paramecium pentaurelia]|uniref:Uncharacterized protein n=1 Tax=Paramecium pentaurelia TaxID=43138 RepID=A0A8S1YJA3_9CILI|nr:unnamed protein product [Paramecium pentaurelia]
MLGQKSFWWNVKYGDNQNIFLPSHYYVDVRFRVYDFSLHDIYLVLLLDDQDFQYSSQRNTFITCNDNKQMSEYFFGFGNFHFSSTLLIQIFQPVFADPSTYWGITDFELYILQCPSKCYSCDEFGICNDWTQFNSVYGQKNLQFMEGWFKNTIYFNEKTSCGSLQFYGPFVNQDIIQHHSFIQDNHSKIRLRFKLIIVGEAYKAKVYVNQYQNNTDIDSIYYNYFYLICGQSQKIYVFDALIQHNLPDLLITIQIEVNNFNDNVAYFGILDFEIFSDALEIDICNDQNINPFDGCFNQQFDCSEGCSNCVKGLCIECDINWLYDPINYNCYSNCGDGLIVGFEECDDSNSIPYDGCYQCKFSCPQNCIKCQYGLCLICDPLFQLINNNCIPYCSNNQSVNLINYQIVNKVTECLPINHYCQLKCFECYYSLCIKYLPDWNLINQQCIHECENEVIADFQKYCNDGNYENEEENHNCKFETASNPSSSFSVCGNGIIQDFEQCDDGNTIPYDGCFECQYQCQENCIDCLDGTCLQSYFEEVQIETCNFGFYLIDNKCLSICGDLIVASDERCDDENNEPFDGCFKCQYSCSLNCQECIDGYCINCENGFQLENNKCQEQCGNGIKTQNEECDDGNIFFEDGCSETCQIEIFWKCINDQKQRSQCFQNNNPIVEIKLLNTTFNKQFILMKSSQQVRLKEDNQNLTQNLKTSIINVNPLDYIITFDVEAEPTFEQLNEIQYLFTIELLKQLEVELIFHIQFNITLINNYGLEVIQKEYKIKLSNPVVLSEAEKEISQKTGKFYTMMLIILAISGSIILLSGNPQDCFEVLDALQYQSYLRFININFPENVFIYFESSDLISIQPALIKFNLVDLFQKIFGSEFLESFGKFYFYQINADLLINLQSQICQILLLLALFIFFNLYNKIFQRQFISSRQLIEIKQRNSMILDRIVLFLYQINKIIKGLSKIFTKKGLKLLFLANSWDVLFKIILFIYSKPQYSIRTYLSSTFGVIIMISLIFISLFCMFATQQNKLFRFSKINRNQGLIVIKKLLFLFFLIKAQDDSIIQCLLLALVNSFYLGIVIISKLIKNNIEIIVTFWFELPIIIFTFSCLPLHNDFVKHLTNDQQVFIGFCQIGILCFGLISPLIKYSYILIKKGIDYIKKKQQFIIAQKEKKIQLQQMFF